MHYDFSLLFSFLRCRSFVFFITILFSFESLYSVFNIQIDDTHAAQSKFNGENDSSSPHEGNANGSESDRESTNLGLSELFEVLRQEPEVNDNMETSFHPNVLSEITDFMFDLRADFTTSLSSEVLGVNLEPSGAE